MKHFELIKKGIDVAAFVAELETAKSFWSAERAMTQAQKETLGIELKEIVHAPDVYVGNNQRSEKTEFYRVFPLLTKFMEDFAEEAKGELSRAVLANLRPYGRVYPHVDWGQYYRIRDRYHLVLQSEGSIMRSGDEEQVFRTGELWRFDNRALHEAENSSGAPRIHLIFDILPEANRPLVEIFSRSGA